MTKKQTAIDWLDNELQKEMTIEHTPVRSYVVVPMDTYMNKKAIAKQMQNQNIEISFQEIQNGALKHYIGDTIEIEIYKRCFENGAIWYREQLKQRQ